MKALTIWQPWAGSIAERIKQYETRSWATNYRGPLAIHAAAKPIQHTWAAYIDSRAQEAICRRFNLPEIFNGPAVFPSACVVATAMLTDCIKITPEFAATLSQDELALGDYTPGRYAWKLENIKKLKHPIPASGRQGLWTWEPVLLTLQEEEQP